MLILLKIKKLKKFSKMIDDTDEVVLKIVLIGEAGVGKTSIISNFIDNRFDSNIQSSIGASFSSKTLSFSNGKNIKVELWDTAGQERYRSLTRIFFHNSAAVVLVYDITYKQSFEELKNYWIGEIKEAIEKKIVLAVVGNKLDLMENEEVNEEEVREFAKKNNALFFQTSAKSSTGIKDVFAGIVLKYKGWKGNVILVDNNNNENQTEEYNDCPSPKRNDTILLQNNKKNKKKKCC